MDKEVFIDRKTIREAGVGDVNAIIDIQKNDGFKHAYYLTPERVGKLFEKDQVFYLVENDARPVGFACADFDVRTWIHFFSVLKDFRGRGAGSALLGKIIEESRARKINMVFVITEKDADSLIGLFKKRGFEEAGFHKDRFGAGKDGSIWNLKLEDQS